MPKPIPTSAIKSAINVLQPRTPVIVEWEKALVPSTAIACPYCDSKSHFTPVIQTGIKRLAWVIQRCDNCSELVLVKYRVTGFLGPSSHVPILDKSPETVYPYAHPVVDPSIPDEAARDYIEAFTCYSAGAFNASVTMSRRAIQAVAMLKGATPDKQLWEQLRELKDKGVEKSLIDLATEIRLLGNVPASHPSKDDLTQRVQPEECKQVLDFLEAFLESVFVRPSKIEKMREARKSSTNEIVKS